MGLGMLGFVADQAGHSGPACEQHGHKFLGSVAHPTVVVYLHPPLVSSSDILLPQNKISIGELIYHIGYLQVDLQVELVGVLNVVVKVLVGWIQTFNLFALYQPQTLLEFCGMFL